MLDVVWLKRDLRIHDHRPLTEALRTGRPILTIYVVEPSIWIGTELSARHFQFVKESLRDLQQQFRKKGGELYVAVAEIEDVLQAILEKFGPFRLYAHEENGTPHTYQRDRHVHHWMRTRGLSFYEYQQFGVVRRLKSRDMFQKKWFAFMQDKVLPIPKVIPSVSSTDVPSILSPNLHCLNQLSVTGSLLLSGQKGGEFQAIETFKSFFMHRAKNYQYHISKPLASSISCSRLSPYLAWGNLSIRFVVQKTEATMAHVPHRRHLEAFMSRIHWHCHFIQRIEDDPAITTVSMNEAFDHVRQEWEEEVFQRWYIGETGIPMIDAAMRSLHQTGWLHFRSRAMVVSFICNTMLLDWRKPAHALAQLFLDYEPGIHYSQMQMQAGTTGFNTIRIYNPIKQGMDHDPSGAFIRTFVPELRSLPNEVIHQPWINHSFRDVSYPAPMVDIQEANRTARDTLWSVKKTDRAKEIANRQLQKHGSRKFSKKKRSKVTPTSEQLSFDLFNETES